MSLDISEIIYTLNNSQAHASQIWACLVCVRVSDSGDPAVSESLCCSSCGYILFIYLFSCGYILKWKNNKECPP